MKTNFCLPNYLFPLGHLPQLEWFNAAFPPDTICSVHIQLRWWKIICCFVSDRCIYSVGSKPRIHHDLVETMFLLVLEKRKIFLTQQHFVSWVSEEETCIHPWINYAHLLFFCPLRHLKADLTELEYVTCVCSHSAHWGGRHSIADSAQQTVGGCLLWNRSVLINVSPGILVRINCSGFTDVSVFLLYRKRIVFTPFWMLCVCFVLLSLNIE